MVEENERPLYGNKTAHSLAVEILLKVCIFLLCVHSIKMYPELTIAQASQFYLHCNDPIQWISADILPRPFILCSAAAWKP